MSRQYSLETRIEELQRRPNRPPRLEKELEDAQEELSLLTATVFLGVIKAHLGKVCGFAPDRFNSLRLDERVWDVVVRPDGGICISDAPSARTIPLNDPNTACSIEGWAVRLFSERESAQAWVDKYRWSEEDLKPIVETLSSEETSLEKMSIEQLVAKIRELTSKTTVDAELQEELHQAQELLVERTEEMWLVMDEEGLVRILLVNGYGPSSSNDEENWIIDQRDHWMAWLTYFYGESKELERGVALKNVRGASIIVSTGLITVLLDIKEERMCALRAFHTHEEAQAWAKSRVR